MSTPVIRLLKKERHTLNEWIRIDADRKWREMLSKPMNFGMKPPPPLFFKFY